ncbi:GNAT family N-acetyltransferase [Noviherbaspirillum sp.]|uniref:GNAT family N-acetyltransferase n=1 Tax=Noviherbaspirillum sp. TaxID=1926288 RepID=UPI002B47AF03|nr:GNAT family N-acetyltransferase [Noviherbaspirillum sp.]HJV80497.1 GNAT family N-acetyltransferase [Noviherbaspirillum sp.]
MRYCDLTISCYDNEVPSFVESEIERLYGNIFSSLRGFRTYGWTETNTSTYVARKSGKISALILFERRNGKARVLNEGIRISGEELDRFADYLFATDESLNVISFKAVETDIRKSRFPLQRFNQLEDLALAFPSTREEYLARLGKNTRRNIKRYTDRLLRAFPSFRFEVCESENVNEKDIRTLIAFNRARMAGKNVVSSFDEEETRQVVDLAKSCGLVGIARIDGQICAGAVSFKAGDNYFLNLLSHDPRYDDYWVGFLCCYLTMCECIDRGGREFHFLWGRYEYKYALGAKPRDLDNVNVYRSRLQVLLNADFAWKAAREGYFRRAKCWLKYDDSSLSKHLREFIADLFILRRSLSDMFGSRRRALIRSTQEN